MTTGPTASKLPVLAATGRVVPWALSAAVALLPVLSFVLSPAPTVQKVLVATIIALSVMRTGAGWLACATLLPLGRVLGRWTGSETSLAEPLVLAFLAGWLVRESLRRWSRPIGESARVAAIVPAALFGVTVLASSAVRLAVFQLWVAFPVEYLRELFHFLWHDYLRRVTGLTVPVSEGAFVLEGVGLFIATVMLTTRNRRLTDWGVRVVAATGAMAACITAAQLLVQVARNGWVATLPGGLLALRTAIVSPDVNAAGSYFLIPLGAASGLALASSGTRRWWWSVVGGLALGGLWLTGSRAALVAAPASACALGLSAVAARGRSALKPLVPVGAALAVVAASYLFLTFHGRTAFGPAMQWRTENGATAIRMFADHPLFGVGVGRFFDLSHSYASPEWRVLVPAENAHNNFLQVLAELGAVGLGLLLWLLVRVLRPAWTGAVRGASPVLAGLVGGGLGFVMTWLTGHPLLQREVALSFWLALGLIVAVGASPPSVQPAAGPVRRGSRLATLLAGLLIAGSVFPRVSREIARADLSRAGMALSNWKVDQEGRRFRWMADRAAVFVPTGGRRVAVPFRSPNGTATIKLVVAGRAASRLMVGNEWQEAVVSLPGDDRGSFQPVEIRAAVAPCGPPADCRLQVGMPRAVD